jgi:hypothetical protein
MHCSTVRLANHGPSSLLQAPVVGARKAEPLASAAHTAHTVILQVQGRCPWAGSRGRRPSWGSGRSPVCELPRKRLRPSGFIGQFLTRTKNEPCTHCPRPPQPLGQAGEAVGPGRCHRRMRNERRPAPPAGFSGSPSAWHDDGSLPLDRCCSAGTKPFLPGCLDL